MATISPSCTIESFIAGADLSAVGTKYKLVKASTSADGAMVLCSTLGEAALGVLQDSPASGKAGAVAIHGKCKVQLGATIARGVQFSVDATGRATTALTTHFVLGVILQSGVVGEWVDAVFLPMGKL